MESKGSKLVTGDDYPYTIIEPVTDVSGVLMTFLMWTMFFFVTIPAGIHDYIYTEFAKETCKSTYG